MRFPNLLILSILVFILIGLISCSGSGVQNPVEPDSPGSAEPTITGQNDLDATANRVLWGFWKIRIDENNQAEIVYLRNANLHFNCVKLLEVSPCSTCLSISNFQFLPDNEITCDLSLKHPFPGHAKYSGFDVRGIFISMSDYTFPESGRSIAWGNELPRMLNYDGYTALFNPTDYPEGSAPFPALGYFKGKYTQYEGLTSTLNPYISYKKYAPRRIFIAGEGSTEKVRLYAETKPFEFGYAVDASWVPLDEPVTDPLNQFPPEANSIEAYQVDIAVDTSDLTTNAGSEAPVLVTIFDHQGLETIEEVTMECPDLQNGVIPLTYSGSPTGGHEYECTLINELGAGLGHYPLVVRVTDTATDGNLGDVDAWQIFDVEITEQATWPPVAIAGADPLVQLPGEWIDFFDDGSYDPDGGDLVKYEWDFNNDDIYDLEGQNSHYFWDTPGTYYVQFRVTDDEGETDKLDEPIEIIVSEDLGNLTGVIKNGSNNEPINQAKAETDDGGYQFDVTGPDGIYKLEALPPGQIQVDFSCDGYIPVAAWFDIVGGETTIGDVVLMAPQSPDPGHLTGKCINAQTGGGIVGVNLDIREGMNNLTGPIIDSTTSISGGIYNFIDMDAGTYTIYGEATGYLPSWINATVIGGETSTYDITFSPQLAVGEIRIVLTWAEHPRDLDSHLFTPFIESDCHWHIAYYSMGSLTSAPYANLDVDDVLSYGPETVTIKQLFPGTYKYFVHHYFLWSDDQGSLSSTSNAVVKVYNDLGLMYTFNVPVEGEGLYWEVFDYDSDTGILTPIDLIQSTRPLWNPRCNDSPYDDSGTYP